MSESQYWYMWPFHKFYQNADPYRNVRLDAPTWISEERSPWECPRCKTVHGPSSLKCDCTPEA